jgi:hypothetical protein
MENTQVADAILDMRDVESREELDAMVANFDESISANEDVMNTYNEMCEQFKPETPEEKIARLEARIAELEAKKTSEPKVAVVRAENVYKIVKFETGWTKKPQVKAIIEILKKICNVGDEVPESKIVAAMIENEALLRTRQGGKRIWQYYKGDHSDGLTAHGNIAKV